MWYFGRGLGVVVTPRRLLMAVRYNGSVKLARKEYFSIDDAKRTAVISSAALCEQVLLISESQSQGES